MSHDADDSTNIPVSQRGQAIHQAGIQWGLSTLLMEDCQETTKEHFCPNCHFPPVAEDQPTVTDEMMEDEQAAHVVMEAKLTKCPKTLNDLWKEYEFLFSCLKPAKDGAASEREINKYKYYKRNVEWWTLGTKDFDCIIIKIFFGT